MQGPKRHALALAIASVVASTTVHAQAQISRPAMPPTTAEAAQARDADLLLLASGIFDPLIERLEFAGTGLPGTSDARYAIVQFEPGRDADVRAALTARGVEVLDYVPNNAWRVRLNATALNELDRIAGVRWAGRYQAAWKIAPQLWDDVLANDPSTTLTVDVRGFAGASAAGLGEAVRKHHPQVEVAFVREDARLPVLRLRTARADFAALRDTLASLEGVVYVERHLEPVLHNDDSISPMQANAATGTPFWDRDLIGTGQIVAVSDSGLDRNESWFTRYDNGSGVNIAITDAVQPPSGVAGAMHPMRKVFAYWVQPGANEYDTNATCPGGTPVGFHGTHVVASVLGDRGNTATPTDPAHDVGGDDGMAPNAQVIFQDIGATNGCLSGSGDVVGILRQARAGGAHIHSNSWGAPTGGAYGGSDAEADAATWELQDLVVFWSAGNSGPGSNTVGSPGNAKNVITVGATNHGDSIVIASFSSVGPTDDARVKPDLVAPGVAIVSAAGDTTNTNVEEAGTSSSKSGTSMSTPTAAGATALLRQYFSEGWYPRGAKTAADTVNPQGPLMKAALLNGTAVLGTWPSNIFGWGRLHLDGSLYFNAAAGGGGPGDLRRMRYFERIHETGVATGENHSYTVNLTAGQELRATLAWFDPEGGAGTAVSLVNNLDLEAVAPDGTSVYLGNAFTGGVSVPGVGTADARNTVEQLRVLSPAAGTWTFRVKGTAVPGNGREGSTRQGYALVVSGEFGVPDPAPASAPTALTVASNGTAGVGIGFTSAASAHQLYRAPGTCATASAGDFRLVASGAAGPLVDDRTQGGFNYAYKVRGIAGEVEGHASSCLDALSADTCSLRPDFDLGSPVYDATNVSCQVALDWAAALATCPTSTGMSYVVERDTHPYFTAPTQIAAPTTTSHVDTNVTGGAPYFYRVRAVDSFGNVSGNSRVLNATPVGPNGPPAHAFRDNVDNGTFMQMEGVWRITNQRASDGSFSYKHAGDGQIYLPDTCAAITTPTLTVPPNATLAYAARYNLEVNWDGVVVEISTDGGSTWADLPPAGGYPATLSQTGNPPINACGYAATRGAYTGSSGGVFQEKTTSLASFAGQNVKIRWRFTSDPGSEEEGFYLDNVRITGTGPQGPDLINRQSFEDSDQAPVPFNPADPGCTD